MSRSTPHPAEGTVVVGGGLAGITAALALADRGRQVTLLESRPRLGGLTASFPRGELVVDTGQHVHLRCCTAYRGLLDRLGVADLVECQERLIIPVARPAGRSDEAPQRAMLRRNRLPAPLHLAGTLARYRMLSAPDRLRVLRGAVGLRRVDIDDPATDRQSFGDWLIGHGQTPATVAAVWDLVCVAALNAPAHRASLALAATVFGVGLLADNGGADIGWSRVPLQSLHGDAGQAALTAAGVQVHTGARVSALQQAPGADGGWLVHTREGAELAADQVVLAVPPSVTERLAPPGAVPLAAGWSQRLGAAPIINVHVVFDQPVLDVPFLAAIDSPVQWVFDRTSTAVAAAYGGNDRAQYLVISLSAAEALVDEPADAVRAQILPALADLVPASGGATIVDSFITRERSATTDPSPGQAKHRPPTRTSRRGLVLAGAHTDTGWPSTMEGAVRSGEAAAAALAVRGRTTCSRSAAPSRRPVVAA